jgi:arsenical pump membrane protein
LKQASVAAPQSTSWRAGIVAAVATNLLNNLPVGLIVATTGRAEQGIAVMPAALLMALEALSFVPP